MGVSPQHHTCVAATAHTFTLDKDYALVEVTNVDGAAEVYYRADGTAPGVAADGSHVLPATICSDEIDPKTSGPTVVKVISAGTPKVSVRGLST